MSLTFSSSVPVWVYHLHSNCRRRCSPFLKIVHVDCVSRASGHCVQKQFKGKKARKNLRTCLQSGIIFLMSCTTLLCALLCFLKWSFVCRSTLPDSHVYSRCFALVLGPPQYYFSYGANSALDDTNTTLSNGLGFMEHPVRERKGLLYQIGFFAYDKSHAPNSSHFWGSFVAKWVVFLGFVKYGTSVLTLSIHLTKGTNAQKCNAPSFLTSPRLQRLLQVHGSI